MRHIRVSLLIAGLVAMLSGCAEPEKNVRAARAAPAGANFEGIGQVALYAGEPCTPQIMFDFRPRGSGSPVRLAARMRESKALTEAANRNRNIRVLGTWQHGRTRDCSYVSVSKVETW